MKQILLSGIVSLFAILLIPTASPAAAPIPDEPEDVLLVMESAQPTNNFVSLLDHGRIYTYEESQYLTSVVLSEMPASFEPEALKAQAVAARTFMQKKRLSGKHDEADVCSDSSCCQAWSSDAALREKLGDDYDFYTEKVRLAVSDTAHEVLLYDGSLIDATYFSCTAGRTEAAVAVWGSDVPYLQSVQSFGEEKAAKYQSTVCIPVDEFRAALPEAELSGDPKNWIGKSTLSDGGGVQSIKIGKQIYTGTQMRSLFGLNSTCFTVRADAKNVTFDVLGYGHRVGMSQYGANHMAQQGYGYKLILHYYYPGTKIETWA